MFYVGFIILINFTIYEIYGIKNSTNWEIFYFCNQNLLIAEYFFQTITTTTVIIYKNYCKLIIWFFVYDTLAQLSYINQEYVKYSKIHIEAKQILLVIISAFIVLIVYKVRKK